MISGLLDRFLKKSHAPDWFSVDMKRHVPENEIKVKIRKSIEAEVHNRGYNRELWDEEFIGTMTLLYYKYFDQLYMQSA